MITLAMMTLLYFLPTILAGRRGHDVLWPLLLNLFAGWTVIGWIALFLWALLWDPPHYYLPAGYYPPSRR
jgi:hypothetical protein